MIYIFNENQTIKAVCNMDKDLGIKRRKFIGKFHSIRQEFGFSSPEILFKLVNIYAISFYGSVLWDISRSMAEQLFTTWNVLIRNIWNLPNTCHRYFIEAISESRHLKSIICERSLTFYQSLVNSKKKCLEIRISQKDDQGPGINIWTKLDLHCCEFWF